MKIIFLFLFSTSVFGSEALIGSIEISKNNRAVIKVLKKNKNYFLEIKPISSINSCLYKIRKISSPAKLKGRNGIIQADQQSCKFKVKDRKIKKYWNDTITIDISYYFTNKENLEGNVTLNSLKKTYKGKALLKLK